MRILPLLFVLVSASVSQAQIARCVEPATGKVTYTEGLCASSSERSGQVPGTRRLTAAEEQERLRVRANESEELRMERERLAVQRERVQLERDRAQLQRERVLARRESELPAGYGAHVPNHVGPGSYACEIALRNLGVGGSRDSRERSRREYELACFGGDAAAGIAAARESAPPVYVNHTSIR